MSRPVRLAATLLGASLLAGCAVTPPSIAEPLRAVGTDAVDKRALRSDAALAAIVDPEQPGCSAAVGIGGDVAWAGAAGLADLASEEPVTTATPFPIASVTKQFTATAILLLAREGEIDLSDPIGRYVGGLPAWGSRVTLEQLMHHESRIPDYWTELDAVGIGFSDPADQAETLRAIARLDRLEPGEGYLYSNSNYVLLAEVVASASGQTLGDFLDARIFTPLGLAMEFDPGVRGVGIPTSYAADLTVQPPGWSAYGHVGIVTTPSELVRWGDQYRAGEIIGDDFAANAADEGTGEYYGAGMDIEPDGDLNHNGRWGGYITTFTVSADRSTTISVACNGHASPRTPLDEALWEIWRPDAPVTPTPEPTP